MNSTDGSTHTDSSYTLRFLDNRLSAQLMRLELGFKVGSKVTVESLDLSNASPMQDGLFSRFEGKRGSLSPVLRVRSPEAGQPALLQLRVQNGTPGPMRLQRLALVCEVSFGDAAMSAEKLFWIRNGWQSWSFCGVVPASAPTFSMPKREFAYRIKEDADVPREKAPFTSDMLGGVRYGADALFVGAGQQRFFQHVEYQVEGSRLFLSLVVDLDDAPVGPDGALDAAAWELEAGGSLTELAGRWAGRKGVVKKQRPPLMAWCSWYQRGPKISFDYVSKIIDILKSRPELSTVKLVQVDDGYQNRVGDWLDPKPAFGSDLRRTADLIRSSGYEAGLWVAPFIAQGHSRLFKEHPDWFLRRDDGFYSAGWNPIWMDSIRALDTSHPGVLEWLDSLFRRLVSYGFTFFKLDYLYPAAIHARRHQLNMGRFEAFRTGLETIRKAVGPECTLLGCGAPLAPSIGLVDAMRVSVDIDVTWENPAWLRLGTGDRETLGLGPATRNSLTRGAFCNPFFRVDPDCLLLREAKSSLTPDERQTALWLASLNGEWVLLGDDLTRWKEAQFAQLKQALGQLAFQAQPLDSLDQPLPQWVMAHRPGETVLAAFNLGAEPQPVSMPQLPGVVPEGPWQAVTAGPVDVTPQWIRFGQVPAHGTQVAVASNSLSSHSKERK